MTPQLTRFQFGLLAAYMPVFLCFVAAIIMLLPLTERLDGVLMPHLVLISVFYWSVQRPLLMPYGACATIGLFLDLWLDVPLGLNMATLVVTRLFALNQLKFFRGRSRLLQWIVFSALALGLYFAAWLLTMLIGWQWRSPMPDLFQWLVTAFAYAPIAFLLGRVRRMIF